MDVLKITRNEAVRFLEGSLGFQDGFLMIKGYKGDCQNHTAVNPSDYLVKNIREGIYFDFEIWF